MTNSITLYSLSFEEWIDYARMERRLCCQHVSDKARDDELDDRLKKILEIRNR